MEILKSSVGTSTQMVSWIGGLRDVSETSLRHSEQTVVYTTHILSPKFDLNLKLTQSEIYTERIKKVQNNPHPEKKRLSFVTASCDEIWRVKHI